LDAGNADQAKNWTFIDASLADVARGVGCHGELVDDAADFVGALEHARASGMPAVIDLRTDASIVASPTTARRCHPD